MRCCGPHSETQRVDLVTAEAQDSTLPPSLPLFKQNGAAWHLFTSQTSTRRISRFYRALGSLALCWKPPGQHRLCWVLMDAASFITQHHPRQVRAPRRAELLWLPLPVSVSAAAGAVLSVCPTPDEALSSSCSEQ